MDSTILSCAQKPLLLYLIKLLLMIGPFCLSDWQKQNHLLICLSVHLLIDQCCTTCLKFSISPLAVIMRMVYTPFSQSMVERVTSSR